MLWHYLYNIELLIRIYSTSLAILHITFEAYLQRGMRYIVPIMYYNLCYKYIYIQSTFST